MSTSPSELLDHRTSKGRISVKTIAITVLALIGGFFAGIVLSEIKRRRRPGDGWSR